MFIHNWERPLTTRGGISAISLEASSMACVTCVHYTDTVVDTDMQFEANEKRKKQIQKQKQKNKISP